MTYVFDIMIPITGLSGMYTLCTCYTAEGASAVICSLLTNSPGAFALIEVVPRPAQGQAINA